MASSNRNMQGKVVIVTGSSTGMGANHARRFAKLGALVSLTGLELEELEKVTADCRALGAKAISTFGDITSEEVRRKVVEDTVAAFGRIDVLVNNAGIFREVNILDPNDKHYDLVMDVNMRSVYRMTALCVPHLIKTKGNIINISSVSGLYPNCHHGTAYHVAKAGMIMFTKSVAVDLAPYNVRVNTISPGFVQTDIMKTYTTNDERAKFYEDIGKDHALGRIGTMDELTNSVVFLASEDASFITGSDLTVDGGYMIHKHAASN
jgi:NAD(P)-dependent dehydrogenase (short-subunit alcohol dehydrogenase family)